MKRTNTTSEIREYTTNVDEPIVISRSLLEEAGINPLRKQMVDHREDETRSRRTDNLEQML